MLGCYHPDAEMVYNACMDMRRVLLDLQDPRERVKRRVGGTSLWGKTWLYACAAEGTRAAGAAGPAGEGQAEGKWLAELRLRPGCTVAHPLPPLGRSAGRQG